MYQILSFDYPGSSNVSIHCLTPHIDKANSAYDSAVELYQGRIVELVQIEDDTLYWGTPSEGVKVIRSSKSEPKEQKSEGSTLKQIIANLEDIEPLERDRVYYIITTPTWVVKNKYKFGGCKSEDALEGRLAHYNREQPEDDLFYYVRTFRCDDYMTLNGKLKGLFCQFLNREIESAHLQYNRLRLVVKGLLQELKQDIDKETSVFLQNNRQEIGRKQP